MYTFKVFLRSFPDEASLSLYQISSFSDWSVPVFLTQWNSYKTLKIGVYKENDEKKRGNRSAIDLLQATASYKKQVT